MGSECFDGSMAAAAAELLPPCLAPSAASSERAWALAESETWTPEASALPLDFARPEAVPGSTFEASAVRALSMPRSRVYAASLWVLEMSTKPLSSAHPSEGSVS